MDSVCTYYSALHYLLSHTHTPQHNPTASPEAYSRTEAQVADNLWRFLQGFYARYPQLLARGLYIFGESYGRHYVPVFAHYLLQKNDAIPPTTQAPTAAPTGTPTPAPTPSPTTPPPTALPSQPRLRGAVAVGEGEPVRIPLKGIGIGDGLTNPALQVGECGSCGCVMGYVWFDFGTVK